MEVATFGRALSKRSVQGCIVLDDETRTQIAAFLGITLEEYDRRMAIHAERERLIDSVTDEQIEKAFGGVPEGDELDWLRRTMKLHVLGLPPDSTRCPDCGGTGDSFRSPAGIVRCSTCGGHGWTDG